MRHLSHHIAYIVGAIILSIIASPTVHAQRERNNIFLFDCTRSMKEAGLWAPALKALDATVATQSLIPDSKFIIIPFGDGQYGRHEFQNGEYPSRESAIKKEFENVMAQAGNTHISPVLQEAFDLCDPARENKIYLLTDGKPNNTDSPAKVASLIAGWCGRHRNTRLFYVALNDKAVDPLIEQAIDNCPDAYIVKCAGNVIPQVEDLASTTINANINELDKAYILAFSSPGSYPVTISCDDPLFSVEAVDGKIEGRRLRLKITPRHGLSVSELHDQLKQTESIGDYTFRVRATVPDSRYFIANPEITVYMADHIQSRLTLLDGSNEEINAANATWYGSFLWSNAAEAPTIRFDLSPVFDNHTSDAAITMSLRPEQGSKTDYTVYFNGNRIADGSTFTITPGSPAELDVVFDTDAQTGKRYFTAVAVSSRGLDVINGSAAEEYEGLPLRTGYTVEWNPLKTLLFWLAIALAAALIFWVTVLRRTFFPPMKASKVIITGPQGYYKSMRVKGAAKAVLSTKKGSQNFLARIFMGKTLYVSAPYFTPAIELTAGSRKKIRFHSMSKGVGGWDFIPSFILAPQEKAQVINRATKEKFNIEVQ